MSIIRTPRSQRQSSEHLLDNLRNLTFESLAGVIHERSTSITKSVLKSTCPVVQIHPPRNTVTVHVVVPTVFIPFGMRLVRTNYTCSKLHEGGVVIVRPDAAS